MDDVTLKTRLDRLEYTAGVLESEVKALRAEIDELRAAESGLSQVYALTFNGHAWYTDGHRAIRDGWPGEFAPKGGEQPDLTPHWETWQTITRPVVMVATVLNEGQHRLAVLSNGTYVAFDWMTELQALRGCTMAHGTDPRQPVVFRDSEGEVVAILMPVYGEVELSDWRGLDGSPLEKPPACVKL
jgi:hypothetical protein